MLRGQPMGWTPLHNAMRAALRASGDPSAAVAAAVPAARVLHDGDDLGDPVVLDVRVRSHAWPAGYHNLLRVL